MIARAWTPRIVGTVALALLGFQPTPAQNPRDVAAIYAQMFDAVLDSTASGRVCVVPAKGRTFASGSPGEPSAQLPAPVGGVAEILRAVAVERLGRRLASYCISRPRSGFENPLARARRNVEMSLSGPTYFRFDEYGAPAIELGISAPQFGDGGVALVVARAQRHSNELTLWACRFIRAPDGWQLEDECRVRREMY